MEATNEEILKIWLFVDVRSNAICFRCCLKLLWSFRQFDSPVKVLVIIALLGKIKKVLSLTRVFSSSHALHVHSNIALGFKLVLSNSKACIVQD